jgi:hypothetical protein
MNTPAAPLSVGRPLSMDQVLRIARLDAERAYRDLAPGA